MAFSPTHNTLFNFFQYNGWGEGFSGTTIKDSWTKPRGRVEAREGDGFGWGGVEGWGENADNCNWTTIKQLKNIYIMVENISFNYIPSLASLIF